MAYSGRERRLSSAECLQALHPGTHLQLEAERGLVLFRPWPARCAWGVYVPKSSANALGRAGVRGARANGAGPARPAQHIPAGTNEPDVADVREVGRSPHWLAAAGRFAALTFRLYRA